MGDTWLQRSGAQFTYLGSMNFSSKTCGSYGDCAFCMRKSVRGLEGKGDGVEC